MNEGAVLSWDHAVADIPAAGLVVDRKANAAELAAIAGAAGLTSCEKLLASYRVKAIAGGGYRLAGTLHAEVTQACVVTLEPVPAVLDEPFDVEYWPAGRHTEPDAEDEVEALSVLEIEPIEHGVIDAGRIVYEQLAASLDPYPRKDGVEFVAPPETQGGEEAKSNPFAVLAKLKPGG